MFNKIMQSIEAFVLNAAFAITCSPLVLVAIDACAKIGLI